MKKCQICNQQALPVVDKTKWSWQEWMTGRIIQEVPEIIIQPFYDLKPGTLCYYHTKEKEVTLHGKCS